VAAFKQMPLPD